MNNDSMLYFGEDFKDVTDPYLYYPDENKEWRFVLQAHIRGRSVHGDLRIEIAKNLLIGYTLDWIKSIPKEAETLKEAKELINKEMPSAWKLMQDPLRKIVTQLKAVEPHPWLTVDDAEFEKGHVGGTKHKKGYMIIIDKGTVEFGALRPDFREYFFHGEHMPNDLSFRLLPNVWKKMSIHAGEPSKTGEKYTVWQCFPSKDLDPYVLSKRAIKKKWYPPLNVSALPKEVRVQIPSGFEYWTKKSKKEANELRDKLIDAISKKDITLKFSENLEYKKLPGMYLVEPHGSMIASGTKQLIIKSRPFYGKLYSEMFLISKDKCYGIIILDDVREISQKEFNDLESQHLITEKEANNWWELDKDKSKKLYKFSFKFKPFRVPLDVDIPQGIQTFINSDNIKFKNLNSAIVLEINDLVKSKRLI